MDGLPRLKHQGELRRLLGYLRPYAPLLAGGIFLMMAMGAIEFLTKPLDEDALLTAIRAAFAQDRKLRRRHADLAKLRERFASLTPREREVLPLVVGGLLNKQAAAVLGISSVTLQVHRGQIMRKMAAKSLAELVRMASKLGIRQSISPSV